MGFEKLEYLGGSEGVIICLDYGNWKVQRFKSAIRSMINVEKSVSCDSTYNTK